MKEDVARSVIAANNGTRPWRALGPGASALSVAQVSRIPWEALRELEKNFSVQWTRGQTHALIKKKLGRAKVEVRELRGSRPPPQGGPPHRWLCVPQCGNISSEELMELQSVVRGLPSCVLKHVKAQEVLNHTKALKNISRRMRKAQLKALLQGVRIQRSDRLLRLTQI